MMQPLSSRKAYRLVVTSYQQFGCRLRQTSALPLAVLGLACLVVAMASAASEQPLPEPTETVIATIDPATWAKVMDRSRHLPQYSVEVFNAPAPGEAVVWGVERFREENYRAAPEWQCFANDRSVPVQERDDGQYTLVDGKEYRLSDPRPLPPVFRVVKRDGKSYLLSSAKEYGPFDKLRGIVQQGQRVMFWFRREGQWYVAVDDRQFGPYQYDWVWQELRSEFSPDGTRFAFTARRGGKWYLIVDGQEFGPYTLPSGEEWEPPQRDWLVIEDVRPDTHKSWFRFSADGSHYALRALRGRAPKSRWRLLMDGEEYEDPETFTFSPDGKRFALTRKHSRLTWDVNVDGQEFGPYRLALDHEGVTFSPDGAHYAIKGRRGEQWLLLVDDKEIGPLESDPEWEFAGGSVCYIAKRDGAFRIGLGDREWGPYDEAEASSRWLGWHEGADKPPWAFRVKRGGAWYAVSGDLELGPFEEVDECRLSPDGSRMVAFVRRGGKRYAAVEGREFGPYDAFEQGPVDVTFSEPSGQVAFPAWRGGQWLLVADGKEYPSGFAESDRYTLKKELRSFARWVLYGIKGPEMERPTLRTGFRPDGQRAVLAIWLKLRRCYGGDLRFRPHSGADQLLLVGTALAPTQPLWFKQDTYQGLSSAFAEWPSPVWNPQSGKLMGIVSSTETTDRFWTEGYLGKTYQQIYAASLRPDGPDAVTFVAGNEGKLLFVRQPLK